jgi:hypothetical protein
MSKNQILSTQVYRNPMFAVTGARCLATILATESLVYRKCFINRDLSIPVSALSRRVTRLRIPAGLGHGKAGSARLVEFDLIGARILLVDANFILSGATYPIPRDLGLELNRVLKILFSLFQAALRPTAPTSSSRSSMTF